MTRVIVNVPEKEEDFFLSVLKKFHFKSHVLTDEEKEDIWLAKKIDEAEKEKGEVSEEEVMKILKRNGAKI